MKISFPRPTPCNIIRKRVHTHISCVTVQCHQCRWQKITFPCFGIEQFTLFRAIYYTHVCAYNTDDTITVNIQHISENIFFYRRINTYVLINERKSTEF